MVRLHTFSCEHLAFFVWRRLVIYPLFAFTVFYSHPPLHFTCFLFVLLVLGATSFGVQPACIVEYMMFFGGDYLGLMS